MNPRPMNVFYLLRHYRGRLVPEEVHCNTIVIFVTLELKN